MSKIRKVTREELLQECDVIRHSLRASDLSNATNILSGLITQIDLLPTDLSHVLERGLRGVLDFFITQQMRNTTLTKDNNIRFVIDSLLTFYSKHICLTIQSIKVKNSLKSLVFSLKQVFLILRHPPQDTLKKYANYSKTVISIWNSIVIAFSTPSDACDESLLEILGDCLDEFYRLSLFTKGIDEMMINISFSQISAKSGTERKAKTKFFITISRFGNLQFTNALSLALNSMETLISRDQELLEAFTKDYCSALDLIVSNPFKYQCIFQLEANVLKSFDFEGVLRFFSEMNIVTHSKEIYVQHNYFILYFTVIWIGIHVKSIISVIVDAVDCFNSYIPTLLKSGVEQESTLLLLSELIILFNSNNKEKRNERLYSASKTIISIISLLLSTKFDYFEILLTRKKEEIITFVNILEFMIDDSKIKDKTEQINFFSTLLTAIFNQPRDKHKYYFDILNIKPKEIFNKFISFTNGNEANIKAAYLALAKGINILIDADIKQHADMLWKLVDTFFTFPVTYPFSVTCAYLRSLQQLKLNKLFRAERQYVIPQTRSGIHTIIWETIRYFLRSSNEAIGETASEVGGKVGVFPLQIIHDPIYLVNELRCVLYGISYLTVFSLRYVLPRQKNPLTGKKNLIKYAIDSSMSIIQFHNSVLCGNAVNTKVKSLTNSVKIITYSALESHTSNKDIYKYSLEFVLKLLHCSLNVFHPQIILQSNQFNTKSSDNLLLFKLGEEMAEMYSMASHTATHPTETLVDELLFCLAVLIRRTGKDIVLNYLYDISSYIKLYHIDHLLACVAILDELTALSCGGVIVGDDEDMINSALFKNVSKEIITSTNQSQSSTTPSQIKQYTIKENIDQTQINDQIQESKLLNDSNNKNTLNERINDNLSSINDYNLFINEEGENKEEKKRKQSINAYSNNVHLKRTTESLKFHNDINKLRKEKYRHKGYSLTDLQCITNQWVPQSCQDQAIWMETNILTNLVIGDIINGFSLEYDERCVIMDFAMKYCKTGFVIGPPDFTFSKKTNVFQHSVEESLFISYNNLYGKLFHQYKRDANQVDNFKSLYQQMIPSHYVIPSVTSINFEDTESLKRFIIYIRKVKNYQTNFHSLTAIEIAVSAKILYKIITTMRGVKTFDQYQIDDLFDIFEPRKDEGLVSIHTFYDTIAAREKDNEKIQHDATIMSLLLQGFYESMKLLNKMGSAKDPISRGIFRIHQDLLWGSVVNHDLFYLNDSGSIRIIINSLLNEALREISLFPINERPDEYKRIVRLSGTFVDKYTHPALKYYSEKFQFQNQVDGFDSQNDEVVYQINNLNNISDSLDSQKKIQFCHTKQGIIGVKYGVVSTIQEAVKEYTETCEAERSEMLRELLKKEMKGHRFDATIIDFDSLTINSIDLIIQYLKYGQVSEMIFYDNLSKIPLYYRSFRLYEAIIHHFTKYSLSFQLLKTFIPDINISEKHRKESSSALDDFCEMFDIIYLNDKRPLVSQQMTSILNTPLTHQNSQYIYNSYFIGHAPFTRNNKYTTSEGITQEKLFTPLYAQMSIQQYSTMIVPLMENILHEFFLRRLGEAQAKYETMLPLFKNGEYIENIQQILHSSFWNYKATPVSSDLEGLQAIQCINSYCKISIRFIEEVLKLILNSLDPKVPNPQLLSVLVSLLVNCKTSHHRHKHYFMTYTMEMNELLLCSPFLRTTQSYLSQIVSLPINSAVYRRLREFFQDRTVIINYLEIPQFYQIISLLNFHMSPSMFSHIVNDFELKKNISRRCLVDYFLYSTMIYNDSIEVKQLKEDYPICYCCMTNALLFNPQGVFDLVRRNFQRSETYISMLFEHYFNVNDYPDFIQKLLQLDLSTSNLPYPTLTIISFIVMLLRHSALSEDAYLIIEKILHNKSMLTTYIEQSNVLIEKFNEIPEDFIAQMITTDMKILFDLVCHPLSL
ncbi:hypothetical protein ENUP19_0001G0004 [Entamoeba nuttalli]|uniref:Uncharacterized protein n=2 Tax=Entamoeba nuttalli TaxID=412467 RepID=K2HBT8_ENTNP|nr:hypothetical protein ENU1_101770 [Entamoeba nuttalli P19]EKE40109.1 hypothetical protein ENU1_101770 [Entamoeba nuttalli P19]|eukprot:XP_008857555.1 hypothetical protein ENU1_101770 [Entamoeba nuttalli P19]